jgi:hypothetical protein
MLLSTLYNYLTGTGNASSVITIHGNRIELDLEAPRGTHPEPNAT